MTSLMLCVLQASSPYEIWFAMLIVWILLFVQCEGFYLQKVISKVRRLCVDVFEHNCLFLGRG